MAADLEKLAREFRGEKFRALRKSLMVQAVIARQLGAPEHFTVSIASRPQETPVVETLKLREGGFTLEEREIIEARGGSIYLPTGLTINDQEKAQTAKNKLSFRRLDSRGKRLIAVPSRQIEVAIFPAPADLFVPGSFNKDLATQERMAEEDAMRLGLSSVTQIIPDRASTLTEVVFQHLDATGSWLFGQEYANVQGLDFVYGRTKNLIDSTGLNYAVVGSTDPGRGVRVIKVDNWNNGVRSHLGAVRMMVPIEPM